MQENPAVRRWIRRQLAQHLPRTKSLIVTLFGDSIEPHGGTLWMGSLVALLEPFSILERSVRTSVFRLVREGWLEVTGTRTGRRSYYRMTSAGRQRAAHAHRRIYGEPAAAWSGTWTLLLLEQGASPALRRDLLWEGFGRLAAQVYAHPSPDTNALQEILSAQGPERNIVGFQARDIAFDGALTSAQLVERGWALAQLAAQYTQFLQSFGTLPEILKGAGITDEQHFVLRTLLIHEFRRAQLRDPHLPPNLLPTNWPGKQARNLCKRIYVNCSVGAVRHLMRTAEAPAGPLRPPAPYFFDRFQGITTAPAPATSAG